MYLFYSGNTRLIVCRKIFWANDPRISRVSPAFRFLFLPAPAYYLCLLTSDY